MNTTKTMSKAEFAQEFVNLKRSHFFSDKAISELYEYLSHKADELGASIELDIQDLCSNYQEMSVRELAFGTGLDLEGKSASQAVFDFLSDNSVIASHYELNGDEVFLYRVR